MASEMAHVLACGPKRECDDLLGRFCDEEHFDTLVTEDTDAYATGGTASLSEHEVIFKLRKGVFTPIEQRLVYEGLKAAAAPTQNRALAAGPRGDRLDGRNWVTPHQIEVLAKLRSQAGVSPEELRNTSSRDDADAPRGSVWRRAKVLERYGRYDGWFDPWGASIARLELDIRQREVDYVVKHLISDTNYARSVLSGIVGYIDRNPRFPYGRPTSYTENRPADFAKCYPYVEKLDAIFEKELPLRWKAQRQAADRIDPKFLIAGSVFSTLSVNHNFRTAAHRDGGDLSSGFSTIAAFTGPDGRAWEGGEFILPEYRIAIRLEPRDLLFVDAHACIHANAPLRGLHNDRLTVVAYFREGMLQLGSREYEMLRRQYVEERAVSSGMWGAQDWFDYLTEHQMTEPT